MNIDDIIKEFREQFGKDFIRPDESIDHERLDDAERFLRFALESYGKKIIETIAKNEGWEESKKYYLDLLSLNSKES